MRKYILPACVVATAVATFFNFKEVLSGEHVAWASVGLICSGVVLGVAIMELIDAKKNKEVK